MVAACWSPAIPLIAIAPSNRSGTLPPKLAEESFTSGSIERGTRRIFRRSSSQPPGWMLNIGGAAVLPDDGAMNRLAGDAVPHHCRFALVGDADRGDVLGADAGFLQRLAAGGDGGGPDVLRLVLDPARRRKMLREFLLRGCRDGDELGGFWAKPTRARGGGPR